MLPEQCRAARGSKDPEPRQPFLTCAAGEPRLSRLTQGSVGGRGSRRYPPEPSASSMPREQCCAARGRKTQGPRRPFLPWAEGEPRLARLTMESVGGRGSRGFPPGTPSALGHPPPVQMEQWLLSPPQSDCRC